MIYNLEYISVQVLNFKQEHNIDSMIDAVLGYCDKNEIEYEDITAYLTADIIGDIQNEAIEKNCLKDSKSTTGSLI